MVLGKMENFVASSPVGKGNFIFAGNLSSTPLKVVSLEDRSSNDNSVENYNVNFNASLVVIVVGVVGFLFFIVFFFIIVCCRSTDGERSRAPRRAGGNSNVTDAATPGLERAIIESFPVFSYNLVKGLKAQAKGSECPVCLSDFQDDETVRLLPKCSHAFHPECIDMWLSSHTTCPVCRTSLLPADDSNPTGTDFGIVEPQMPPEQVVIDIDNGGIRRDISNDKETDGPPEPTYDSMRHSLVRVRKELEQQTEWYIATPGGLKPGLHKSCSFVANHHSKEPSSSNAPPVCSKPGGSVGDGEQRSRSERWGNISMNPALFVRNFSERVSSRPRDQVGVEQQDHKPYLTRTFSWLMGGNRDRDRAESSQNGSVSSRHADRIVGTSAL